MRPLAAAIAFFALAGCNAEAATDRAPAPPAPSASAARSAAVSSAAPSSRAAPGRPPEPPSEVVWPAPAAPEPAGDRIYSKVRFLWVRPRPGGTTAWLGYLSLGDSVRVKGGDAKKAIAGKGGSRGCESWYAVEPVGYVCTGDDATLDASDPAVVELTKHAADASSPWPYRYGESRGAPVYQAPPSAEKQRWREPSLETHLARVEEARQSEPAAIDATLIGVDLSRGDATLPKLLDLPPGGRALQSQIVRGSTLAFTERFEHEGRTFLMTWDRGFIPADKVVPYPEIDFHGVVLGGEHQLPIAWFRERDRAKYRLNEDGSFVETGARFPRLGFAGLSGERRVHDGRTFLAARDGSWLAEDDATIAERAKSPPPQVEGDRTWLDISILGGTLVAYEGARPVYATLVSPGRGGMPHPGVPTLDTASTPTGVFSVLGKFVTATMQSGSIATLVHAEVQYTQNISGPYAIHGAYWHDRFGEPKSGGCVNLAPIDAQRIFSFTRPRLPPGWHGMRTLATGAGFEPPTLVSIHR